MTSEEEAEVAETLARAYLAKQRHMEAMVVAKKAIANVDLALRPKLYVLLAEVYADQRKKDLARQALAAALDIDSKFQPALKMRDALLPWGDD